MKCTMFKIISSFKWKGISILNLTISLIFQKINYYCRLPARPCLASVLMKWKKNVNIIQKYNFSVTQVVVFFIIASHSLKPLQFMIYERKERKFNIILKWWSSLSWNGQYWICFLLNEYHKTIWPIVLVY